MAVIGKDIEHAAKLLSKGGLVAIPTETVYGLAANAYNTDAVVRVFEAKNRPSFDPLIVHCHELEYANNFTIDWDEDAKKLADIFWPGPLTLLIQKRPQIPELVTSGMDRVAVRVPDHSLTLSLLKILDFPLVAPSANPFGYISPTSAQHVKDQLGDRIDYILDGGECEVGVESTIVGFDNNNPVIYRLGGLDIKEIESEIGKVILREYSSSNPQAPGMLTSHYSPRKKVILGNIEELLIEFKEHKKGVLLYNNKSIETENKFVLTPSNNIREAAKNLFSALRSMDQLNVDLILAEYAPNEGLGLAINDRLMRAASQTLTK